MVQFKHLRSLNKNMKFFAISTSTVAMATSFVCWNVSFGPFLRHKIWKTKNGFRELLFDNQTEDEYQTSYRRIFWPINGSHSKKIWISENPLQKVWFYQDVYAQRKIIIICQANPEIFAFKLKKKGAFQENTLMKSEILNFSFCAWENLL